MSSGLMMPCIRKSTPSVTLNATMEQSGPLSLPLSNLHNRTNLNPTPKSFNSTVYQMDDNCIGNIGDSAAISATSCVGKQYFKCIVTLHKVICFISQKPITINVMYVLCCNHLLLFKKALKNLELFKENIYRQLIFNSSMLKLSVWKAQK